MFFTRIFPESSLSVNITPSGSSTAGETYSLICSATLTSNRNPPLPDPTIPAPTFEWFYGPNGDVPLPFGLAAPETVLSSGTYTSTLQFSPLNQSHAGNYTCRLGVGSLVNNNVLAVDGKCLAIVEYLYICVYLILYSSTHHRCSNC